MIEGEEQELILNTLAEQPQEEIRTLEEDIYVIGVESLNGQAGDLTLKNINGEDLVGEGNIALQTPLTETQMDAVDSGIDSTKVAQIATNAGDITTLQNTKQDNLTQTQLNAVNSGIDQTKVAQIATNTGNIASNTNRISTIEGKIPSAASSSNQLTDKNYVDNSIATNTANYISDNGQPFQSYADLVAYSGTLTNNDYAFVVSTDAAGNLLYTRYKYNASQNLWAEEYTIANPTFTSDQWASINSGVTANDVSQIGTNKTDIATLTTSKQDALSQTQLDAVNSGINATKVQQIADNTTAIATKQDKLVAGTNIQIAADGKTISATDTKYTAGTGLTLTGTQFSVTEPVPAGFFTDTASTQEGEGTQFTLNNTTDAPIDGVELKGNTTQTTYTGKNLFKYTAITSAIRCSYTDTDGKIVCTATGDNPSLTVSVVQIPTGTYTCSGSLSGVTASPRDLNNASLGVNFSSLPKTIATTATMGYITFYSSATTGQTFTIDLFDFQIEAGSTATAYEPYVGGLASPNPDFPQLVQTVTGSQTVSVVGKNLWGGFTSPFSRTAGTVNFTTNADGTIYASGTASSTAFSINNTEATTNNLFKTLPAGTYRVSSKDSAPSGVEIRVNKLSDGSVIATAPTSFTLTETTNVFVGLRVASGTNISTTVCPQIELGSATTYEPYQGGSYGVNLGSMELCKIGTYQDYIYKSGSDWYVHRAIGKTVLDGTEDWFKSGTSAIDRFGVPNTYFGSVTSMSSSTTISDHFRYNSGAIYGTYHISGTNVYFDYTPNGTTTKDQWVSWLSSNHTTVYYVVGTPTDTQITDADLIADLEALAGSSTYAPQTNYATAGTGTNLPVILTVEVFKNNYAGLLARLEKAGA